LTTGPPRAQARRPQLRRDVVLLPVLVDQREESVPLEAVATLARHVVDPQAARDLLGRHRTIIDDHFLRRTLVRHEVVPLASTRHVADPHAVDLDAGVRDTPSVHRNQRVLQVLCPTHIHEVAARRPLRRGDTWDQDGLRQMAASRGNRVEHLLGQGPLRRGVLHVHHRRRAGDGNRFFEPAHPEVGVDDRGNRSSQLEAFPLDDTKARQRERHAVVAGAQIDDAILARAIGCGDPHFLNQRRTRRLDRHAREHRARGVLDHTRDGRLRQRQRR
jgi:hypothetical protein